MDGQTCRQAWMHKCLKRDSQANMQTHRNAKGTIREAVRAEEKNHDMRGSLSRRERKLVWIHHTVAFLIHPLKPLMPVKTKME